MEEVQAAPAVQMATPPAAAALAAPPSGLVKFAKDSFAGTVGACLGRVTNLQRVCCRAG